MFILPEGSSNEVDIEKYPLNRISGFENVGLIPRQFGLYNVWLISLTKVNQYLYIRSMLLFYSA